MAVSDADNRIKGTATIVTRDWLDERLGTGWFHATAREVDPEWPEILQIGGWYPLVPQVHAWDYAQQKLRAEFDNVEAMLEVVAGLTAEKDLTSVHKAFLWASSPRMFLRAVPLIWQTYTKFGEVTNVENVAGTYVAKISKIPKVLMPWSTGSFQGFLPPALRLAGAEGAVAEVSDRQRSKGEETWEFIYRLTYQ